MMIRYVEFPSQLCQSSPLLAPVDVYIAHCIKKLNDHGTDCASSFSLPPAGATGLSKRWIAWTTREYKG
jgi:hypothetical protein